MMNKVHFSAVATQFRTFLVAQCATLGQKHFQNTPQLLFLMLPTTLLSFVQIGAL